MELVMNKKLKTKQEGVYFRARNRVERLRKYYFHVIIYFMVNTGISTYKIVRNMNNGESFEEALWDLDTFIVWIIWGIILLINTFAVFGIPFLLGKNWEEEKIKKYMEADQSKDWR